MWFLDTSWFARYFSAHGHLAPDNVIVLVDCMNSGVASSDDKNSARPGAVSCDACESGKYAALGSAACSVCSSGEAEILPA